MARPWFAFYPGDYIADTMALNAEQHGAYLMLLMAYWQKQGALPDDDAQLSAICRLPPKVWRKHKAVLSGFFTIADGLWRNNRMESEIAKTNEIMATKSAAGRKSAAQRQQTGNGRSTDVGTDVPTQGATDGQQSGQQKGNQPQPQLQSHSLEEKDLDWGGDGRLIGSISEKRLCRAQDLKPRFDTVRGGAKRFAGLGERPFKPKNPNHADQDLLKHLTTREGMDPFLAQALVVAARDPASPNHFDAARQCEKISRKHKIGWFHMEAAE